MNITINNDSVMTSPPMFPIIMIHKNDLYRNDPMIVLFTSSNTGICLSINANNNTCHSAFEEYDEFDIDYFIKFNGSIALSN